MHNLPAAFALVAALTLTPTPALAIDPEFERAVNKVGAQGPCAGLTFLAPYLQKATPDDIQAVKTLGPGAMARLMYKEPQRAPQLRALEVATAWQQAIRNPALVWMKRKPNDPAKTVASAELAQKELACPGYLSDELLAQLTAALTAHKAYLAEEARCAADPKCQAERMTSSLCDYQAQRAAILHAITTQHSYAKRTRVIAVGRIAELRDDLQLIEEQIAKERAAYRGLVHKAWSGRCPR